MEFTVNNVAMSYGYPCNLRYFAALAGLAYNTLACSYNIVPASIMYAKFASCAKLWRLQGYPYDIATLLTVNSILKIGNSIFFRRNNQYHICFLGISNFENGVYCQQCGYVIWISLQSSQFCTACGFGVHYTCMDNIMRTCVALKVKSQPDFIMDICPERILPQLKYRWVLYWWIYTFQITSCLVKFRHSKRAKRNYLTLLTA